MLIELLEQGKGIPAGTKPERVHQVMRVLENRLLKCVEKTHVWMAVCTRAVEAGVWTGNRIARRRLKLAGMIAQCATFLGQQHHVSQLPQGWEQGGLYYGYDAVRSYAFHTGRQGSEHALALAGLFVGMERVAQRKEHN